VSFLKLFHFTLLSPCKKKRGYRQGGAVRGGATPPRNRIIAD